MTAGALVGIAENALHGAAHRGSRLHAVGRSTAPASCVFVLAERLRRHRHAPQMPLPPARSSAPGSPGLGRPPYFVEISLNAGPTSLLSMPWQAGQAVILASCACSGAPLPCGSCGAAARCRVASARSRRRSSCPRRVAAPTTRFCSARLPCALRAKSGRNDADRRLGRAVVHAGDRLHVGLAAVAQSSATGMSVVMPLRLGSSFCTSAMLLVRQHEVVRHHVGEVQQEGGRRHRPRRPSATSVRSTASRG